MKRIALVLCLIILSSAAVCSCTGCGQKQDKSNTITLWHWMTDRDKAFQELAKRYEEQTGIKVIIEVFAPSDAYSRKIIASAQAKVLPDIFGILDKKHVFASFIESNFVTDLTEEFQQDNAAWEKKLYAKAVDVNRFSEDNLYGIKPGIYGVPIDVTNIQMLYNKKLLEKAGIKNPPQTFDEFMQANEALKRVGVPGLVSGWGELWLVNCFAYNYAFNILGEEKILATFRGEIPYTDPDWIKVFNIFKILRDKGALIEGIVTKTNKYAEQDFALERAAFAFNGSWCVNVYRDMNPDLEYGVMLPPAFSDKYPIRIWGGAGSSFVINNNSTRKPEAIAFLKWLTEEEQQVYLAGETQNLPSNRNAVSSIPQILSDFAQKMGHTTHPTIWPLNEKALVGEEFDRGLQSIIIGEKTPEQVAQEVQKVKEREMERDRNQ